MKRIIIVEDDSDDQEFLTEALMAFENISYTVFVNSIAMLKMLDESEHPADVSAIVIDYHLPLKGGFETLLELKRNPRTSHIPVVILTASILHNDECMNAGCSRYLIKPSSMDDYRKTAKHIMEVVAP
ncbi:MAG: response regulator [Chitinophagaceae bacterium]